MVRQTRGKARSLKTAMTFDLDGKTALVTGASGSLGQPIARALAEAGADVACHYNTNQESISKLVEEIKALGRNAAALQADLTEPGEAARLVRETIDALGSLSILVNNAGVSREALIIRQSPELVQEVLRTNLETMFFMSQAAAKTMTKQRWGRLIHIGSVVTYMGSTAQSAYAASKAGVMGMSRAIARELGSRNITSNVIAPGLIDAGMADAMSEERRKFLMPFIAAGRMGRVEEVAGAVVFLASDIASYITGTVLHVNGGLHM